jgi:hypothetical protein
MPRENGFFNPNLNPQILLYRNAALRPPHIWLKGLLELKALGTG